MASAEARVERAGTRLRFSGHLDRAAATRLWAQASAQLQGVVALELDQVTHLDSAGMALLAEVSARVAAASGQRPELIGNPAGLAELRAAYRLDPRLDPAGESP